MTYIYDEQNKTNTKMCWTEDNRMQAYVQMNEGEEQVIIVTTWLGSVMRVA